MINTEPLCFAGRALFLVAAVCAGAGPLADGSSVLAEPTNAAAIDLPIGVEERSAVIQMLRQGVMRNRTGEQFSPAEPTTYGDYLLSLQHLFSLPQSQQVVHFSDVPPNSPYYAAVQATAPHLNRQAMCFRCALSTNLYPEQSLTRALSIVPLISILHARGTVQLVDSSRTDQLLQGVQDAQALSPLARQYVATAISNNIISLSGLRRAELSQIQTRANTAVMLHQAQTKFHLPEVQPPTSGGNMP